MPDDTERPRLLKLLLDGVVTALRDTDKVRESSPDEAAAEPTKRAAELPPDTFDAGVRAGKMLHENACPNGDQPWGQFILPPDRQDPEDRRYVYEFPFYWRRLFRKVSEEQVVTLQGFMAWLTPARFAAEKQRMAEAEERAALSRFWKRIRYGAASIAVTAFAVASWGVEQIPVVRETYKAGRDLAAWWHGG